MFSRCIAILFASLLPVFAVTLPLGPEQTANLMVSGILATLLSFGSLVNDRLRFGVALIGGWVALSPFVIWGSLLEAELAIPTGVAMFVGMIGPFSEAPRISFTRTPVTVEIAPKVEPELARAA